MINRLLTTVMSISFLAACGGSGSSSSPTSSPQPSPTAPTGQSVTPTITGNGFSLFSQSQNMVGQSISLAATSTGGSRFTTLSWTQTAGPDVNVLASHTSVIAFDAEEAGTYTFQFSANNSSGQSINQSISVEVSESDSESANVRLDHAVAETSKVSLRVDGSAQKTISSISWQQLAGPNVVDSEQQGNYLFFDAPSVNSDSVIEFETTLQYEDGSSATDRSFIVVNDVNVNNDGFFPKSSGRIVTPDVFAYQQSSPYANELENCVYNNTVDRSCSFDRLPLIGQENENPTIDNIMDRVLVSHTWMGDRFKQYLEQSVASGDMLSLLRATTAVVISYDIRPSFYWSATGAIYLDANNFWVTANERDTLNDQPDFRSGFGNDLQFSIPWRYVKDNEYYFSSGEYPASARLSKSFGDLEASITWLMYHELGHANDFFPPAIWQSLSRSTSPLVYINENEPNSTAFSRTYPLVSDQMRDLAQVSFAGATASNEQKALSPDDVVLFFEPDDAPAYYSYSSIREDYATLFERFMMSYRMNVSADVAVLNSNSANLDVAWGQRDRISDPKLQLRVREVVEQILPGLNVAGIQPSLPQPVLMTPGLGWRDNLLLNQENGSSGAEAKQSRPRKQQDLWTEYQHHFPKRPEIR